MAEVVYLSKEGYQKIQEELDYLVSQKRAEVAEKLKEARAFGDLSENAEYDAAKDEQAEVEERILQLESMIKNAEVINEEEMSNEFVGVGSKVKLKDLDTKEVVEYIIVGTTEADPFAEPVPKISNESLIGQHIIGKKKKEKVEIVTLEGTRHFQVTDITR